MAKQRRRRKRQPKRPLTIEELSNLPGKALLKLRLSPAQEQALLASIKADVAEIAAAREARGMSRRQIGDRLVSAALVFGWTHHDMMRMTTRQLRFYLARAAELQEPTGADRRKPTRADYLDARRNNEGASQNCTAGRRRSSWRRRRRRPGAPSADPRRRC